MLWECFYNIITSIIVLSIFVLFHKFNTKSQMVWKKYIWSTSQMWNVRNKIHSINNKNGPKHTVELLHIAAKYPIPTSSRATTRTTGTRNRLSREWHLSSMDGVGYYNKVESWIHFAILDLQKAPCANWPRDPSSIERRDG